MFHRRFYVLPYAKAALVELGQIVAAVAAIYLASLSKNLRSLFVALRHAAAVSIKSPEKCAANGAFKLACFAVELCGFCVVARRRLGS